MRRRVSIREARNASSVKMCVQSVETLQGAEEKRFEEHEEEKRTRGLVNEARGVAEARDALPGRPEQLEVAR